MSEVKGHQSPGNSPTDTDDGVTDAQSRTSTDAYSEHEPFETFKDKVRQLCRIYWPSYSDDQVHIERMRGGSSNRIISISVTENEDEPTDSSMQQIEKNHYLAAGEYILRVPRSGAQTGKAEIAMLSFIKCRISIGTPAIVLSDMDMDTEEENPLGTPWILQHRVVGKRLDEVWLTMNHTQRLLVTLDLARLCVDLRNIQNASGGIPDMLHDLAPDGALRTIDYAFIDDEDGSHKVIEESPPHEMLCRRLSRWTKQYDDIAETWERAAEMVQQMHRVNGTFETSPDERFYYFCHGDLFPRNIMVEILEDTTAYITGILDWDDAYFAPPVIAFSPPAWLWSKGWWAEDSDDENYLDEVGLWKVGHIEPEDQDSRDIKELFDSVTGPQYLHFAYSPDAHAARRIWRAAHERIGCSWTKRHLDELYNEWAASSALETPDQAQSLPSQLLE
ncbi:hypothetical protein F5Y16DRAFT_420096 [Xylariaceae sp. FL0255]|nr:hypothetical protein F5Y16DRAFT_420096 [Xylariaceae sp. FL0255]